MAKQYPQLWFERFADDAIVHLQDGGGSPGGTGSHAAGMRIAGWNFIQV
jgi:hypothetical protein